jgi:ribosome-associated protein
VRRPNALNAVEVARRAAEVASDKQASDVVLLDIRQVAGFADYFVICSGASPRQIRAIAEAVIEELDREGVSPYQTEGTDDSGWVIIDYGAVVVHVFSPRERDYYRLERLWSEAVTLLHVQ